jgi:hypothetical protein
MRSFFFNNKQQTMSAEYEKIETYIVTALEEYDHESGVRIILYEGDILTDACNELSDCENRRNPALYSRV